MNIVIELIKGFALFLWPALIFYILRTYREELRRILDSIPRAFERVTSAELPGLKFNMTDLNEKTSEAAADVRSLPDSSSRGETAETSDEIELSASAESISTKTNYAPPPRTILDPATPILVALASSPVEAVSQSVTAIEKQLKQLMATSGLLRDYAYPEQAVKLLAARGLVPTSLAGALETFFTLVRSSANKGMMVSSFRAIAEEGVQLVRLISEVPRSYHQVLSVNVPLFKDPNGQDPDNTAKGVVLRGIDQFNRPSGTTQIFPTTKQMFVGAYVSWEWNGDASWSQRWFRDPTDGEIKAAWSSSAEFVGRDLNELP